MAESSIIAGGKLVEVPGLEVSNWLDSGMSLTPGRGVHTRPADATIHQIVVHYTASERRGVQGARTIHQNFRTRRDAGAHFFIDNDGATWQFADVTRDYTSHVSHPYVKVHSVGIEVSNIGWSKTKNFGRDRYPVTIHGWKTTMLDFFPAQHLALGQLVGGLCDLLGIPKVVATEPFIVWPNEQLEAFNGVLGHLHCASGSHPKIDPGPRPLEKLASSLKSRSNI